MRSVAPVRRSLLAAAGSLLILAGLVPAAVAPALAVSPDVVISEVYGGGGNSGATLKNDFIELYNRGAASVSLAGWSVQYASAGGTSWQVTPLSGSIAAGGYYLVHEAAGAGGTVDLPTADATGSIPMSATAGKVALVTTTTPLSCTAPACDTATGVRDFVGYGTTANDSETAPAPTLSNTTAAIRASGGSTDTDNNAADFSAGTPDPDNSGTDAAPAVASTSPANGASGVATNSAVSVTFTEPVTLDPDAITFSCTPSGPAASVDSGPATTFNLVLGGALPAGASCTISVDGSKVHDGDTGDPPDVMAGTTTATFTVAAPVDPCTQPFTSIPSIQGNGASAAITGNVTTQGVVVGDFEGSSGLQGIYLQDATGDSNAGTSDGIFVFTGSANTVTAGQVVRVTGFARERSNQTAINGTNSNTSPVPAANILSCGTGSVAPTDVELPFAAADTPERYEGMLVRLPQALVISEYFNYERFGEMVLALPLDGENRAFTPTSIVEPGVAAQARAQANALRRITLDDGLGVQNPSVVRHPNGQAFSLTNRFRGGDTVANTVGVVGFDFSLYRIQPTGAADYTAVNARPAAPEPVGGSLRAAAMNTLNFFLTLDTTTSDSGPGPCGRNQNLDCRGADADQPAEFTRQRDKLIAALAGLDADVIGLNELENTPGVDPLGDPTRGIVAGLNAHFGPGTYDYIDTGVIGTDAIRVGLVYRTAAVTPVGRFQILDTTDDPRFRDTLNRPVLAQTFEENASGARFTVAVNHLKSKGSDCNAVGDPDTGDGQGNCNQTRKLAAQALVDWLATDPTGSGDRDYLILGDLNSYAQEDPIDAVKAGPDDDAGTADDYTNLIARYGGTYAYSYVFDGQAGYLDHALASPTLTAQLTAAADWHINADEPDLLDYDTTFKPPAQDAIYEPNAYRSSDHDSVVVGLDLLAYAFDGFRPPVDNPPVVNAARAGQAVPVTFDLADGLGLDVLFTTPTSGERDCATNAGTDALESVASPGDSGLQQDPETGEYTFVWKTGKGWAGDCRDFEITFDDGTFRRAFFAFTR